MRLNSQLRLLLSRVWNTAYNHMAPYSVPRPPQASAQQQQYSRPYQDPAFSQTASQPAPQQQQQQIAAPQQTYQTVQPASNPPQGFPPQQAYQPQQAYTQWQPEPQPAEGQQYEPQPYAPYQPQQAPVPPPQTCAWSPALVNSVQLIGNVGTNPHVTHLTSGQVVAVVSLAVRPNYSKDSSTHWFRVEFWGQEAQQVEQYITRGTQIAVTGQLRTSTFQDKSTGQPVTIVKVQGRSLQVVLPPERAAPNPGGYQHKRGAPPAGVYDPYSMPPAAPADRTPRSRQLSPRQDRGVLSPAAEHSCRQYSEDGALVADLAAAKGVKETTVWMHLLEGAALGHPLDLPRLASDLQLGPPGSPWVSGQELDYAIDSKLAEAQQAAVPGAEPPVSAESLPLRSIRDALLAEPTVAAKVSAQEAMTVAAGGTTYNQIKLALALRKHGIAWSDVVTDAPATVSGGAGAADDIPPF